MIDLHVHSTFSDGTFTPRELVAKAVEARVTLLALTDHDTTDGVVPFLAACGQTGGCVTGIPGVELSVAWPGRTIHLLGYFVNAREPALEKLLRRVCEGRRARNLLMIERLEALGIPLTIGDLERIARGTVIGRPHFARALCAKGAARSPREAFDRYLARDKAAYADRYRPEPAESIAAIRSAGGVAVLAHPGGLKMGKCGLRTVVGALVDAGLAGIEVYYPEHTAQQRRRFASIAADFNLVETGGSDFHGTATPKLHLGRGTGRLQVPESAATALAERAGVILPSQP